MEGCKHLAEIRDVSPSANGCEDCLKIGATWLHLRLCMYLPLKIIVAARL